MKNAVMKVFMKNSVIMKIFLIYIRMSGKNINFDYKKIRESIFYKNKTINNIKHIDVNNILVSRKEAYGNKNSIKYFMDIIKKILLDHYV